MPSDWVSGNPEWTRQAAFPGRLALFQLSQVESRKTNALANRQVGTSAVVCEDIQAGTTDWWRPGGSHHHHCCSGRETEACREKDLSQSSQPSRDRCPRLGSKATVPATTKGYCTSMPWALSQSVLFCMANNPKIR